MLKTTTKTSNGRELKLWLDKETREMKATLKGIFESRSFYQTTEKGCNVISCGTVEHNGEEVNAIIKLNNDIKEFIEKAEKNIKELEEQEKHEELTFEVIETSNSGAYAIQDLLLVPEEKILSEDQQEKIWELENILGMQQRFAGASEEIKAQELPVEKGETYTLEEIIKMCKELSQSWQNTEENQEKEESHYQECLEEAKETGKNVKFASYTVECNDPNEECNIDIIGVYVTPSGQKEKERIHTY